jgi:hypothetical protein
MAFVNEYITDQDRQKYGLDAIDGSPAMRGRAPSRSWTIDQDRSIYLRYIGCGREEFGNHSTWHFFWDEQLLTIDLVLLQAGGNPGGPCWSKKRILKLPLPPQLEAKRDEIIADLREALVAYKDGGVFSKSTTYTLTLDV